MLLSGAKCKLFAIGVLCAPLTGWAQTSAVTQSFITSPTSLNILGWALGSQNGGSLTISTNTSLNYNNEGGSLVGSYPTSPSSGGAVYVWGAYGLSQLKTEDIYVEFWAKMPNSKQGLKFLKIFGGSSTSGNYANTTFALDYTGGDPGSMYQVSFGDGSTVGNDTANVINFDGSYPNWIGRSYGKATVQTPQKASFSSANWGTSWHHFRIHCKFNSGTSATTEVNDGAYYVEIDGKVYVNATGLFNRNYSNLPIDRVELFGWSQNAPSAFQVWYDDVRITTGGFASGSTVGSGTTATVPDPPSAVSVQ
jgi:hypothetical protein